MSFQPGSLIGFGLLFVVLCAAGSLFAAALLRLSAGFLKRRGPRAERAAAAVSLVAPVGIAFVLSVILMATSFAENAGGARDHCRAHDHHLHLCVVHGAAWADSAPPIVVLALSASLVGLRLVRSARRFSQARRDLRLLEDVATPVGPERGFEVRLVDSEQALCVLSSSNPPALIAGAKVWSALDEEERAAVLEHERAHLEQHDPVSARIFAALSAFGAPMASNWILSRWRNATERSCDRSAAEVVSPEAVASALVRLTRVAAAHRTQALLTSFPSSPRETEQRIEALLAGGAEGRAAARRLFGAAIVVSCAVMIAAIALSGPLHHLFESLVGIHVG